MTASFVARYGIAFLPALLVVNAILIILGTLFFETLITRIKKEVLMIVMLLIGATCLFLASFLYGNNDMAFYALIIFAESVFLAQFNVFIPLLVADRFTPLESQKTFPFIESGETIGGIIGGVLVGFFAAQFSVVWFLYIWISLLACAIFVFVISSNIGVNLPPQPFRASHNKKPKEKISDQLKLIMQGVEKYPFLKILVVIVLLQWIFLNVLDFQFTKAFEQSVTNTSEKTLVLENNDALKASVLNSELSEEPKELSLHPITNIESGKLTADQQVLFTEKLGKWRSIFHASALVIQILIASRLITSLGIVGAMLIHPLVMLLSLLGMLFKFSLPSVVVARLNFEISNVIHKNAYLASHYAFPKHLRDQAAEFLEGVIRPIGTIVGMTFILGSQLLFSGQDLSLVIHIVMFVIMTVILLSTLRLQSHYTEISRGQLFAPDLHYVEKLNAIEILSQKGHEDSSTILVQKLSDSAGEHSLVKMKLLSALGRFRDYNTLPEIIDALSDPESDIRLEAAHALMNFHDVGNAFFSQAFSKYRMMETLKNVFRNEESATVRSAIIRVFSLMKEYDIVSFLLNILSTGEDVLKSDCIYTLGLFKDPNITFYVKPFLSDANPKIRANAIIALWQFNQYRPQLERQINSMLASDNSDEVKSALFVIGEIKLPRKRLLYSMLNLKNSIISLEAAYALAKIGDQRGFNALLDHYLASAAEDFVSFKHFYQRLGSGIKLMAKHLIAHRITEKLSYIGNQKQMDGFLNINSKILEKLRRLYILLDEHEELFTLEAAMANKFINNK